MATITSNLTNLKNSRLSIINKANAVLGTTMKETTTLSEIPSFLEATGGSGAMINFDTWNAKSITITYEDFTYGNLPNIGHCRYKLITAEQDGYLSLALCLRREDHPGVRGEIRIKTKNSDSNLYTWAVASCSDGTDWWDNTGGVVALSLNTYISKGNKVAIMLYTNSWFSVRNYGCTFYYK